MPMTEDASFFAVVGRQRAHRRFSTDPVTDEVVARLLTAATYAPSAENRQPWEFIVVRDEQRRTAIAGIMQRAWEVSGRAHSERRLTPEVLRSVDDGMTGGFATAPVMIVVAGDSRRGFVQTLPSSVFPAVQNLLLAATALGLGSALTTIATVDAKQFAPVVELPDHIVPLAVVPLGWPARALGPPKRDPFDAHTHRDAYGAPW
jgi:nitroreductase